MPSFFNLRGYTALDPLDKADGFKKCLFLIGVNLVLTAALIYLITTYKIVYFNGFTLFHIPFSNLYTIGLEVITNAFIYSIIIVFFRKSSSLIPYLIVFLPYFLLDLYLETHVRPMGSDKALWMYYDNPMLSEIKIPALKFFLTLSVDAVLFGIVGLFLARLISMVVYRKKPYPPKPTKEQYRGLFNEKWSYEPVEKPKHDAGFWILRLLGLGYLVYLSILLMGIFGEKNLPGAVQNLVKMTYDNPALAINTYFKIATMTFLAFLGAYNKNIRWHACLVLLIGHGVSTIFSIVFSFYNTGDIKQFLIASVAVDGAMMLLFSWIMIKSRNDSKAFSPENDFPVYFSVPATLMKFMFLSFAVLFLLISAAIILTRLFCTGDAGISAVYGYPDPMIGNTVTLYAALSLISYLLIRRDRLRNYFYSLILFPLVFGSIVSALWIILGDAVSDVRFVTRFGNSVIVDWYFILYAAFNLTLASVMLIFRKMYFNVDYGISTISPSSAKNILALTNAFFDGDSKHRSSVLQSIDQYVGGIRGRKRGLLNLPFGLLENVFNLLFGLRPPFSSMSGEEQRRFLKKYILKDALERERSFIPVITDFASDIMLALNAMVMFAHYSNLNVRHAIGYVPLDARDRTQGDCGSYPPPFKKVAGLPKNETDPLNFKPVTDCKLVAPRVTTPVFEHEVPREVDYLIVGSGAGGATAAYRLACAVKDPSGILVVERGNRYQPLQDFNDNEMDMTRKIFKEGGLQQTKTFTMVVLQGECVGGTTVSNNAVCFEMPSKVSENWQTDYGINLAALSAEYAQVKTELDIKPLGPKGINTIVQTKFINAVNQYNGSLPPQDRLTAYNPVYVNHLYNIGDGNWNLGNKRMRKRSMLETYIPWSESRGVKVVSNLTAVRFVSSGDGRKAEYVILRTDNGEFKRVTVRKAVIVAGGVIASSHFLMRSEVKNENIGKGMSCNFGLPVAFDFDEKVRAYDGEQITVAALDPRSRAAFETYFNPPAAFALAGVSFFFGRRKSLMDRYEHLLNFGALIGSQPNGIIHRKADLINGQAFTWELGTTDIESIKYAVTALIRLGRLAGSTRAVIPTKPGIELDLLNVNDVNNFINLFNAFPLRMSDIFINTGHPQGGNLMAGQDSRFSGSRVVDEDFRVAGYDNVFVADASLFPTSLTINPQWTIMAMSSMSAKSLLKYYP